VRVCAGGTGPPVSLPRSPPAPDPLSKRARMDHPGVLSQRRIGAPSALAQDTVLEGASACERMRHLIEAASLDLAISMDRSFFGHEFCRHRLKIAMGRFTRQCPTNSLDTVARIRRHKRDNRILVGSKQPYLRRPPKTGRSISTNDRFSRRCLQNYFCCAERIVIQQN
jgi:hypothetical protein